MLTIKKNTTYIMEQQKSKFIVLLFRVENEIQINEYLKQVKIKYPNATHYCYAYKLETIQKCSDDKEPSGTAGIPIMEVLNKKNLDYILCVVVRYFGGIKLGAGGLVRAYTNATREAINSNEVVQLVPGYSIQFESSYEKQKVFDYQFSSFIQKKEFSENVTYYLNVPKQKIGLLECTSYRIIKEILIEKEF